MGHVPDDPFYPPPPEELEEIIVGDVPFVVLQVIQGPVPSAENTRPFVIEVHAGGGLTLEQVPRMLRSVVDALAVGDMGITADGTLIRRTEAPPRSMESGG